MKSKSIQNIITYSVIMFTVLLLILYLYFIYLKRNKRITKENFTNRVIYIKNNFYDITPVGSEILTETSDDSNIGNKVGASNLCIYTTNQDNITDIECITSGEFNNALELPEIRKKTVCIEEECLELSDLKMLIGEQDFLLKSFKTSPPNRNNFRNAKCVKRKSTPIHSCSGDHYKVEEQDPVHMLGWDNCYDGDDIAADTFKMDDVGVSLREIQRIGVEPLPDPVTGSGDSDDDYVIASH